MTAADTRTFSASTKLAAVERELTFRHRVYPRLIAKGDMTRDTAREQILVFEAIADDYRTMVERERLL